MQSSDLTEPRAREVSASPTTNQPSPPHSSHGDRPRMSPFASQKPAMAPDQAQPQPFNEITPIVSNGSSPRRNYNSTEGLRNRETDPKNGTAKNPQQRNPDNPGPRDSQLGSAEPSPSWYSRLMDRYGSLELENKGSVARDHLALERTFLAWLRTSLAFASIGIAVTQLFRLNTAQESASKSSVSPHGLPPLFSPPFYDPEVIRVTAHSERLRSIGKPLGTTFIGVAIVILLVGFHRYFESQYWIIRGKFPASRGSVALIAFIAAALIVAALVVILAISPGAVEP